MYSVTHLGRHTIVCESQNVELGSNIFEPELLADLCKVQTTQFQAAAGAIFEAMSTTTLEAVPGKFEDASGTALEAVSGITFQAQSGSPFEAVFGTAFEDAFNTTLEAVSNTTIEAAPGTFEAVLGTQVQQSLRSEVIAPITP